MRSRPRLFWFLAVGGSLLTAAPFNSLVRADAPGPAAGSGEKHGAVTPPSQAEGPASAPKLSAVPLAPMPSAPAKPGAVTPPPSAPPALALSSGGTAGQAQHETQPQSQADPTPTPVGVRVPLDLAAVHATGEEMRFLELTNEERAKRGLSRLVWDPLLTYVARLHSDEMRCKNYFSHHSPTTGISTPMDRYLKVVSTSRPTYACVGENLYYCTLVDVQRGHNAFMNSPTHRENVLFPRYERMGVGIVKNERGEFWVTEMFLTNTDPNTVAKRLPIANR